MDMAQVISFMRGGRGWALGACCNDACVSGPGSGHLTGVASEWLPQFGATSPAPSSARAKAGIPDDQVIQTCIAMGWPDESFPANAVVSQRRPVDAAATFLGFVDGG